MNKRVKPQGFGGHASETIRNSELTQIDKQIAKCFDNQSTTLGKDGANGDKITGLITVGDGYGAGYFQSETGHTVAVKAGANVRGTNINITAGVVFSLTTGSMIHTPSFTHAGTPIVTNMGVGCDAITGLPAVTMPAQTFTRWEPLAPAVAFNAAHSFTGTNTACISFGAAVGTFPQVDIPIRPLHGSSLTDVYVHFIGAGSHTGLPGQMPIVALWVRQRSNGLAYRIGYVTDTSANTTAYQAIHNIQLHLPMIHVVDKNRYSYFVRIYGESGANFVTGGLATNVGYTISACTTFDQAANL